MYAFRVTHASDAEAFGLVPRRKYCYVERPAFCQHFSQGRDAARTWLDVRAGGPSLIRRHLSHLIYLHFADAARGCEEAEQWAEATALWRRAGRHAPTQPERMFCLVKAAGARVRALARRAPVPDAETEPRGSGEAE